jgi:hypothetical protein
VTDVSVSEIAMARHQRQETAAEQQQLAIWMTLGLPQPATMGVASMFLRMKPLS